MPIVKDEKSLERVAGEMAFSRGRAYYLKGAVKRLARKESYLEGFVQGSQAEPYHVRILMKGLDNFRSSECTCPFKFGSMCKHAAAVLLHWVQFVAISESIDLSQMIYLDEKRLISNAQTQPLPGKIHSSLEKPPALKKPRRSGYLLAEYAQRSYQQVKIQIVCSAAGFIGGGIRGIPFKVFIIKGKEKLALINPKLFLNNLRTRNTHFPQMADLSPRQKYVLNYLNEFLTLENHAGDFARPQFKFKRMQWAAGLGVLAACPDVEFIDGRTQRTITIKPAEKIVLSIRVRPVEDGLWGVSAAFRDTQDPERNFQGVHIQEGHPVWLFWDDLLIFQPVHESITYPFLTDFLNTQQVIDRLQMPYFIKEVLDRLRSSCEIIEEGDSLKSAEFITPSLCCRLDLNYVQDSVRAKLSFVYGDRAEYPYEGKSSIDRFVDLQNPKALKWIVRNIEEENSRVQYLLEDCSFVWRRSIKSFVLTGMRDILGFVYQKLPMLKNVMDVRCSADFESKLLHAKFFEPVMRLTGNGIDWFEFDTVYKTEGIDEEITHERIKKLVLEGQDYIRLKQGEIVPIPKEFFDRVESIAGEFDSKRVNLAQMPFVIEEINRQGIRSSVDAAVMDIYNKLKDFKSIEKVSLPGSLSGVLRDYQVKGMDWLAFLNKFNFGGILADEMGLGKTLQALGMVQLDIEQGQKLPSLVVCPTTLVWNWQEEIKKFLPHVKVLTLNGNHRREHFDEIAQNQVVITSYSLLRRDIGLYKNIPFNYIILDEAQNIKNRHTRNARVAKSLSALKRLAMTGTPVENSIMDLWSIFDFLMPGFLGSDTKFKRNYEIPITKFQDKEQLAKLSSRILPFVLRRLKKDVIKDLPQKLEQVSYCELEPTQAKIYAKMIDSARLIAGKSVQDNGFEKSRMVILTLILRLRQICCHPLIAGVNLGHRSVSGKMELLKETLDELLAGGHKVLIFSQFVSMLRIMEEYLTREKISYAYMDGSSSDRQQEVARFNADSSLKVFLLSLKVGGVGLNLTSADTVIIYEPWWNPAVENQAIDRVHRIGQQNSVLAYRMITKGTIEEKMLELQNRKRFLMDALVLSEENIGKKLDWEDIKFLLDMKG